MSRRERGALWEGTALRKRKRPREGDTAPLLPSWLGDPSCVSVRGGDCVASARSLSSPEKEKSPFETKALVSTWFVAPK